MNRPPLRAAAFISLPPGSVRPTGWLGHMLLLEAKGMGGRLEEISPWLEFDGSAWTSRTGEGKNGWEEVGYWLRGYGDLGYVLHDEAIVAHTKKWLEAIMASSRPDGYFGPEALRTSIDHRPDTWPQNPVCTALCHYHDYTGDPRVIDVLTKYFHWYATLPDRDLSVSSWGTCRISDYLDSIYWLYNHTGDKSLLALAKRMHEHSANFTSDVPTRHNVNYAEGFREPAEYWQQSGDQKHRAAPAWSYGTVMSVYGQFPGGGLAGDENWRTGYCDPRQGFETCGIVEFMYSFERLQEITGDNAWADRCETLAFNSLPAALTPDLKALHYLTAANQVQLDKESKSPGIDNGGTMFSYSPYGVYRCCQHNHVMGWPYFVKSLWHATAEGGLAATLYAPCSVTAKVAGGRTVTIEEQTNYPFSETIAFAITTEQPVNFPLLLRTPGWAGRDMTCTVNGKPVDSAAPGAGENWRIERSWSTGDKVELTLPMHVAIQQWPRNQDAVSVNDGPLTFSLAIKPQVRRYKAAEATLSDFVETEVFPASPWNYGLHLEGADPTPLLGVHRSARMPDNPFTPGQSVITITAPARRIAAWKQDETGLLEELRPGPIKADGPDEMVTLVPMGSAPLRITSFPQVSDDAHARAWGAPEITATASHVHDSIRALFAADATEPRSSGDGSIARFTFWDHKGTAEWAQLNFATPRPLAESAVYWFDDQKGCRRPASWRLLYQDGETWKPVALTGGGTYPVEKDRYSRVTFEPVTTRALRIEVQLAPRFSTGILRWKIDPPGK